MDRLLERLRGYAPLWGQWIPETRIYRNGNCCVYTLSGKSAEQGFSCVVKVVTVLGREAELEQSLADVRQEIAALERLRGCENVVTLYDDACFPLYDGDTLIGWDVLMRMEQLECVAELLREGESLSVSEVGTLARDIAAALAASHRAGLIHRDVKPANLYRTADGRFQLGDFSIVRRCRAGVLETMTGTAAYIAPEVARGEVYDGRADLYSLGIVLYQLLNHGQLPLMDENTPFSERETAVRRRWQGAKLPSPPEGDRRMKRIILRCCQAQPQKRFSSADALLQALERTKNGWRTAAVAGWACAMLAITIAMFPYPMQVLRATFLPPSATKLAEVQPEEGYRYAVVKATMNWEEAQVYCETRGGHLATITSQKQMDTITELLEENQINTVWLGANNYSSSSGFRWVTGAPFEFAAWAIGEPNNDGGDEHYLMMYRKDDQGWVWNDSVINGVYMFDTQSCGFVCQWDESDG